MPLQVIGQTPGAHRRVGVITRGEFYGKHLSGKVLGGGSDWIRVKKSTQRIITSESLLGSRRPCRGTIG
jgi:hypothetical protein